MAISVTTDLTTITAAESTTDSGTFYRLNGTSNANPAQDLDAFVQGTGCVANKMGATSGTTDTGGHFNHTTTFDLSGGKHLYHWRQIVTAGNMQTTANQGVVVGLTNTSVTSNTAWSATNFKKWYIDGSDLTNSAKGWECYVVDPASTPNASAGTLTLTTVKNVGFLCRQISGVTTTMSNQFVDVVRAGTGVTATASSGADVIGIANIYSTDSSTSNKWGIVTQVNGVYFGAGKINIGASGQTNVCNFIDADQVLIWKNFPVDVALYAFNLIGNGSFATTMELTGWVVRGQSNKTWDIVCGTNAHFKAYGCSFANIRQASLSSASVLDGCNIDASGTLDINGTTITNCSFSNQTASQLKVDTPAELAVVTASSFNSDGTGHAIEITAVGTYDFENLTFADYAASNGSTGNEAVYVNVASGSVTLNINGGTTPSVRTAGATVTVVAGAVTVLMTVSDVAGAPIQNAQVLVAAAAGGPFSYQTTVTITNSGTTATVNQTAHPFATNDKVLIKGASHAANNGVFSITVTGANSYTYTMASAPGSNPTGTIRATFVVLSGTTNASGQISMSRVFPSDQPVSGWARKSSGAPYFKTGPVTGTVDSGTGANFSALLIADS